MTFDVTFNPFTSKLQFVQAPISGDMIFKGDWDASSGSYPDPVETGWYWIVTVAGTLDGVVYNIGDNLVARNDATSPTASDVFKVDNTEDESVSTTQSLAVGDTLTVTHKTMRVQSAGGDVTSTATPTISAGSYDNQPLILQGMSETNRWTIQDESVLTGSLLRLNGSVAFQIGLNDQIAFRWSDGQNAWIETWRSPNSH